MVQSVKMIGLQRSSHDVKNAQLSLIPFFESDMNLAFGRIRIGKDNFLFLNKSVFYMKQIDSGSKVGNTIAIGVIGVVGSIAHLTDGVAKLLHR